MKEKQLAVLVMVVVRGHKTDSFTDILSVKCLYHMSNLMATSYKVLEHEGEIHRLLGIRYKIIV